MPPNFLLWQYRNRARHDALLGRQSIFGFGANLVAKSIHFFPFPWQFRNLSKAWRCGFVALLPCFCFDFLLLTYILHPPPTVSHIFASTTVVVLALLLGFEGREWKTMNLFLVVSHSRASKSSNEASTFFNTSTSTLFNDYACGYPYAQVRYPLLSVSLALVLHELPLTNAEPALTDHLADTLTAPLTCHAYFRPSTPSSPPLPPTNPIKLQPRVPYLTLPIHQTGSLSPHT